MKKLIMILPLTLILCFMVGCQKQAEEVAESKKMEDNNGDWQLLTDMPTPRFNAGICKYKNQIYVFGGTTGDKGSGDLATASVEMYSPDTDSWAPKKDMLSPRTHPSVCVLKDKIYVLGGAHDESVNPLPSEG